MADSPRAPRRGLAIAVQVVGFALSLAVLAWLVRVATSGEQAAGLSRLREISLPQAALLIGLSLVSLALNGLLFWVASRPASWSGRVSLAGIAATNALATLLAYLPFKVSAAVRVAVHVRRDGVSVAQTFAWFGCFFAAMGGSLGPMVAASLWRGSMDGLWWLTTLGGMAVCLVLSVGVARWCESRRGRRWLDGFAGAGPWRRVLTPVRIAELHESFTMVASWRWLVLAYAVRCVDMLVQALRFDSAGRAVGEAVGLGDGVVLAAGHYGMLVVSPFGALGAREAGAVGAGALIGEGGLSEAGESLAAVTLLVSGAEVVTLLVCGLAALAWLGPGVLRGAGRGPRAGAAGEDDAGAEL